MLNHFITKKLIDMGFKPGYQQRYYIIAKHSGMALSVADGNMRTPVLQQTLVQNSQSQKMTMHNGNTFCWISTEHGNRFLHVASSLQDNDAPIIQWEWLNHAPNSMFHFIHAGDGYYYIMALHSGKFFDIFQGSGSAGGKLVQHPLNRSNNQIFKVIPIPDTELHSSPATYVEVNEKVRSAIISLVGGIPKAGAGIAFIVKAFWKETNVLVDFWEQMKSYVDNRIQELIRADKIKTLTDMLNGKLKSIGEINDTVEADRKTMGSRIYGAIDDIVRNENLYMPVALAGRKLMGLEEWQDDDDSLDEDMAEVAPANNLSVNAADPDIRDILPLFIGIGTILITLRRTIAYDRDTWFSDTISDAQKAKNKELLVNTITQYKDLLAKGKERLVAWRLAKIKDAYTVNERPAGSTTRISTSYAQDDYGVRDERRWSVSWEYVSKNTKPYHEGDPNHLARASYAVYQRRQYIKQQFEAEVDELLQLARYWGDFDPTATKYAPQKVRRTVGAFGGWNTYKGFGGVADKTIAKIIVHARGNNSICGLEVFYKENSSFGMESDGISSGLIGVAGNAATLKLGAGEYINSAFGSSYANLQGLWFATNLGRVVGGGDKLGHNGFNADLPDSFHAHLVSISGFYAPENIESLSFQWEYEY